MGLFLGSGVGADVADGFDSGGWSAVAGLCLCDCLCLCCGVGRRAGGARRLCRCRIRGGFGVIGSGPCWICARVWRQSRAG